MKLLNLLILFMMVSLLTVSCSSSNTDDADDGEGIELTEDGAEIDMDDEEGEEIAENKGGPAPPAPAPAPELVAEDEGMDEEEVDEAPSAPQIVADGGESIGTGSFDYYQVQKGDTLMLIAFKIYGDYLKWKLLAHLNTDKLDGTTRLHAGMKLQYERPNVPFQWNPEGNPYLIIRGDSLGRISHKVYGSDRHWKYIWDNNRPMIKNPSLIFAGFTLYYLQLRDIASE